MKTILNLIRYGYGCPIFFFGIILGLSYDFKRMAACIILGSWILFGKSGLMKSLEFCCVGIATSVFLWFFFSDVLERKYTNLHDALESMFCGESKVGHVSLEPSHDDRWFNEIDKERK